MAAASAAVPWAPPPAAVQTATAAAPRGGAWESALLALFAEYGRLETGAFRGPLAGYLVMLASHTPDGDRDGLRLCSDVLVPTDECALEEAWGVSLRDELCGQRGLPCAPSGVRKYYFAPHTLPESEHLGWSPPCRTRRAQAPHRKGYRPRSGAWRQPGGRGSGRVPAGGKRRLRTRSHESRRVRKRQGCVHQ